MSFPSGSLRTVADWARPSGRPQSAARAIEQCHRLAPNSRECAGTAAHTLAFLGRCEEAEREARLTADSAIDALHGPLLLGLGRSREAVVKAFERSAGALPYPRDLVEPQQRWMMAMADGEVLTIGLPAEVQAHPAVLQAYLGA